MKKPHILPDQFIPMVDGCPIGDFGDRAFGPPRYHTHAEAVAGALGFGWRVEQVTIACVSVWSDGRFNGLTIEVA